VTVTATQEEMERIGDLDLVLRITTSSNAAAAVAKNESESYYDLDGIPALHAGGWDGDGIVVAVQEGARWGYGVENLGAPPGNCSWGSQTYQCACPSGIDGTHVRQIAGVVRNTVDELRQGTARGVTLINANHDSDEELNCDFEAALDWAVSQGAQIITRSAGSGDYSEPIRQAPIDLVLDYYAMQYPYPVISVSAGNSENESTSSRLSNGLVVGAAQNTSDTNRDNLKTMRPSSSSLNYHGAAGWELPHLVAPGNNIDTAGSSPNTKSTFSATSAAQPQVGGIAAALLERSASLHQYPEAVMAVLLAATEQDVAGVWPLSLKDSLDDADGVGAVHGEYALTIAGNYRSGNQTAVAAGFGKGYIYAASLPEDTFYSQVYWAKVPPLATLRVALVASAQVACSDPLHDGTCSLIAYPELGLWLYQGTSQKYYSGNYEGNYQYAFWRNTSLSSKTVAIKFQVGDWNGLSYLNYGIAWGTGG